MKIKIYVVELLDKENNCTIKKGFLKEGDRNVEANQYRCGLYKYYTLKTYEIEKIVEL